MKKDPHEPQGRLEGLLKNSWLEGWLAGFNGHLADLELPDAPPACNDSLPIIYIVGLPRSGTTLLSQLFSRCLDAGYINNLIARFWRRPSVGVHLSRAVLGNNPGKRIDFNSQYGVTQGAEGPHEFGYFWRYWLQLDKARTHHLTGEELKRIDAAGLKRALECELLGAFNKPLVMKSVVCGFLPEFLSNLHPLSIFIYIGRDLSDIARSLLHARKARYGNYAAWWSLKPMAWPFEAQTPAEEVALQVRHCHAEMNKALELCPKRVLRISYEELCKNPKDALGGLCEKMALLGAPLKVLHEHSEPFVFRKEAPLPDDMEKTIGDILR